MKQTVVMLLIVSASLLAQEPPRNAPKKDQEFVLSITKKSEMSRDTAKNEVTLHYDSNVQRANYNHYIFSLPDYDQKVKTIPVRVKVRVLEVGAPTGNRTQTVQPQGGIKNTYVKVQILQIIPDAPNIH